MCGLKTYLLRLISCCFCVWLFSCGALSAQVTDTKTLKKELERVYQTKNVDSLNNFLSKYYSVEGNDTLIRNEVLRIRDEFAWKDAQNENTLESYKRFISLYPESVQSVLAQQKIDFYTKQEQKKDNLQAYQKAKQEDNIEAYQSFINDYPSSQWVQYARERISQLQQMSYDSTLSEALNNYSYPALVSIYEVSQRDSLVNFDSILSVFSIGYVQNGQAQRFDQLFAQFSKLKQDSGFVQMYNDTKTLDYLLSSPILDKKRRKPYSKYFNRIINDKTFALLKKYSIHYSIGRVKDNTGKSFESPIYVVDSATGSVFGSFVSNPNSGLFFYTKPLKPSYIIGIQKGYISIPLKINNNADTLEQSQSSILTLKTEKKLFVVPLADLDLKGQKLSVLAKTYFWVLAKNLKDESCIITLQSPQATKIKEYMVSVGADAAKIVASNDVSENENNILQIGFID